MTPLLVQDHIGLWWVHHRKPCDCENGLDTRFVDNDGDYFRCEATGCDGETRLDDWCSCRECDAMQAEADALNEAVFAARDAQAAEAKVAA